MMDLPAETPLLWVGLVVAAAGLLGIAGSLPTRPAPDATGMARTVDSVAVGDTPASATHRLRDAEIRLRPHGLDVRRSATGEGETTAQFAFGPVTPIRSTSPLWPVLEGTPPSEMFDSPVEFQQAVVEARTAPPRWVAADHLTVRGVSWDGYRVTLVGV